MKNVMQNLKLATGLALFPTLILGAFGYKEDVQLPVMMSCFAMTWLVILFPPSP